jgi:hypothetical protein
MFLQSVIKKISGGAVKLLLVSVLLIFQQNSTAQNQSLYEANAQLRAMFSPLDKPLPVKKFLLK